MGKSQKENIQTMYRIYREQCNRNTAMCFEFLRWLHQEKHELHYLKDMEGLTEVENQYIYTLLKESE